MVTVLQRSTTRIVAMLLVLAALGFALYGSAGRAEADSAMTTWLYSGWSVSTTNGHGDLGYGTGYNHGVYGASCTGHSPRGGPNIPVGVVTEVGADYTYVRVLAPVQAGKAQAGTKGTVYLNCVFDTYPKVAEELQAAAAAAAK